MATVHPSRMALIPQEMREMPGERDRRRNRSPSPRRSRRSPSPRRSRSREQERDSGYDRSRRSRIGDSRERGRDRDGYRVPEPRRGSPAYDDYKRPPPPSGGEGSTPWKPQDTYAIRPYYTGSGADFLEDRRIQRENRTANAWPPSPKEPARDLSPKRSKKSSRKSKRQRSSSSSSSEEEKRRRERKEKRARRAKEKEERRDKKRSRHREEDEDDDAHERRHRRRSRSRSKSKSARPVSPSPSPSNSPSRNASPSRMNVDKHPPSSSTNLPRQSPTPNDDDSGEEVGPQPVYVKNTTKKTDERAYGGALLRGEGSAMAAFLQDGTDTRIPRRGEIGLTSDEIAQYEDVGYVMSGSRHRRMNAVRMRKENQVISAEEKRGILKLQREEKARRESILREEFSELVNERLKASSSQTQPK